MKKKTAAERKADKAFIDKLKTLSLNRGTPGVSEAPGPTCPDCGEPMKLLGMGMVYGHPAPNYSNN